MPRFSPYWRWLPPVVLAVVVVIVAVGSVTTTYRIGDSGAQAAWVGKFSPTPLPSPPRPGGEG